MAKLIVHQDKITNIDALINICPFGAIEAVDNLVSINSACKMCKICVKRGEPGAIEFVEETVASVDKSQWVGVAVFVDHVEGEIHPVTMELIGKARELAVKVNHPVYAVFIGHNITTQAEELLHYGVDKVFVYDQEAYKDFRIEPYTRAFEDFVMANQPSIILVGATTVGRSLAPRLATRFRTGLTADCTILDVKENTDLVQIRPAFGGNIMAQIITPNNRPQLATVRYKVMSAPERMDVPSGEIVPCSVPVEELDSRIKMLDLTKKEAESGLSDAEVIVVAGRAVKSAKDLEMINELAELLGGQVAITRPLVESGLGDAKRQIGLSGRTVRPKLIITCGVSGAVQFTSGMNNADCIVAINKDEKAPIFGLAHYGIVGDIYEIIPKLTERVKLARGM